MGRSEVCGWSGDVWERWRCVTEVEKCGGRGGGEYRSSGDVWEGVRCVTEVEKCGGRGGGV